MSEVPGFQGSVPTQVAYADSATLGLGFPSHWENRVEDSAGAAVDGLSLELWCLPNQYYGWSRLDWVLIQTTSTSPDGSFRLPTVSGAAVSRLLTVPPDSPKVCLDERLNFLGESWQRVLALPAQGSIQGTLLDSSGSPLGGRTILMQAETSETGPFNDPVINQAHWFSPPPETRLFSSLGYFPPAPGEDPSRVVTDAEGRFRFAGSFVQLQVVYLEPDGTPHLAATGVRSGEDLVIREHRFHPTAVELVGEYQRHLHEAQIAWRRESCWDTKVSLVRATQVPSSASFDLMVEDPEQLTLAARISARHPWVYLLQDEDDPSRFEIPSHTSMLIEVVDQQQRPLDKLSFGLRPYWNASGEDEIFALPAKKKGAGKWTTAPLWYEESMILALREGYEPKWKYAIEDFLGETSIYCVMTPRVPLTVRVQSVSTGQPIAGIHVLVHQAGPQYALGMTDHKGKLAVQMAAEPDSVIEVQARHQSFEMEWNGIDPEVVFSLEEPTVQKIRVVHPDPGSLELEVMLRRPEPAGKFGMDFLRRTQLPLDADGSAEFSISGITDAVLNLHPLDQPDILLSRWLVRLDPGTGSELVLNAVDGWDRPLAVWKGRITVEGAPVPGFMHFRFTPGARSEKDLSIPQPGDWNKEAFRGQEFGSIPRLDDSDYRIPVNENGEFYAQVPAGAVYAEPHLPGVAAGQFGLGFERILLEEDQTHVSDLDFKLGKLTIQARLSDGQAASRIWIMVVHHDEFLTTRSLRSDGHGRLDLDLVAGKYGLVALPPGSNKPESRTDSLPAGAERTVLSLSAGETLSWNPEIRQDSQ